MVWYGIGGMVIHIHICSSTASRATVRYFAPYNNSSRFINPSDLLSFLQRNFRKADGWNFCASQNLNSLTQIPWSWHGVEKNKQGCCDISVGKFVQRCEIAPRRFQVKSIIDKVSAVATQVDYMATRRQWGHTHIKVLTHGKLTQGGKINRKLEIQQGHKHRSITTAD